MSGTLIRILPRTDFVATNVGTTVIEQPLGIIDVTQFNAFVFIGRIHAKNTGGTAQTLNAFLRNAAPTVEDVLSEFPGATVATATFVISGGTAGAQAPQIIACTGVLSYKLRLVIAYSQGAAGTPFTFSFSADGLGRE